MKRWGLSLGYSLLIYASLPFSRAWQQGLRAALGAQFGLLVNLTFLLVLLAAALFWGLQGRARSPLHLLLLVLSIITLAAWIDLPEERVHLIEYGLLGALLMQASPLKTREAARFMTVLALGTLIGLGDESIQWFLPERVFDWRDVAYNGAGISFGAALMSLLYPKP